MVMSYNETHGTIQTGWLDDDELPYRQYVVDLVDFHPHSAVSIGRDLLLGPFYQMGMVQITKNRHKPF